jgi:uncharacterized membrane protein
MEKLIRFGVIAFGLAMAGVGIHQLFYGEFSRMMVPPWPINLVLLTILSYVGNIALAGAGLALVAGWRVYKVSLILGLCFLVLFCFSYIPYELIIDPYTKHFGVWTNALKELAFAGGAFAIAGTYRDDGQLSSMLSTSARLVPFGSWFFSFTMISFGIMHFMYMDNVATLIPAWMPDPLFWTCFAGVTLIGGGVSIVFEIRVKAIANLLGLMILLWFVMLHIPRAIADPYVENGNEVASAFSALAFSGTAFVIANSRKRFDPIDLF